MKVKQLIQRLFSRPRYLVLDKRGVSRILSQIDFFKEAGFRLFFFNKLMENKIKRFRRSFEKVEKANKKLIKSKAFRIWVENNPKIHILNYPYYRIKERAIIKGLIETIGGSQ